MPRPRVTFSRNGSTSSGFSGPPNDTRRTASYGVQTGHCLLTVWLFAPQEVSGVVAGLGAYRRVLADPSARAFTVGRLCRPAAAVDDRARHRVARLHRHRLVRAGRAGDRGRHHHRRGRGAGLGPPDRPDRPGPRAGGRHLDQQRESGGVDHQRAAGLAAGQHPGRRGRRRTRLLLGRCLRTSAVDAPASGHDPAQHRLRLGGGAGRGGLHRRSRAGDVPGHLHPPGAGPGGRSTLRTHRIAGPGRPTRHRATCATGFSTAGRLDSGFRYACWCRSSWRTRPSVRSSAAWRS